MKEIHEKLRDLREDQDLTQQNVADYLGIGRTMYRRYETGETEIPVRHLKKLCILYNRSADYILGLGEIKKNSRIRVVEKPNKGNG